MVQTFSQQAGFADPGLLQILSLFDPLEAPFALVEEAGSVLYENAAFLRMLETAGLTGALRLADVLDARSSSVRLFSETGALNPDALPYAGRCRLRAHAGASGPGVILRLDLYQGAQAADAVRVALCTIKPLEADGFGPVGQRHQLAQWLPRIEEVADSFDLGRVAAKCCKTLVDMAAGRAATMFCREGAEWRRVEQIGEMRFLQDVPETLAAGERWVAGFADDPLVQPSSFEDLRRMLSEIPLPRWLSAGAEGFALPCRARGDTLGLVFVWGDPARLRGAGMLEALNLLSFEAAQAIDHSRWFRFARQSDSRGERLIENANAVILGIDFKGVVTLWNRKAEEVFGWSKPQMLGRPLQEALGEETSESRAAHERFRAVLRDPEAAGEFEVDMADADGARRHVSWTATSLSAADGSPLGVYLIGHDLTHRRELERSLAVSERRYRSLVESTHDLYWIARCDAESFEAGDLIFLNRSFAGRDRETLAGESLEALRATFAEGAWEAFREACLEVLRTGRAVRGVETRHVRADDASRGDVWLQTDVFPYLEEGAPAGVQGLSVDVTDRKDLEAQMLQAQKSECVGTLARGVAHDFNNIINGINGFAALIENRAECSEKIRTYAHSIQDLSKRGAGLTRQLQTYARQSQPQKRPLDLNEMIRQSANMLRASVARRIEIELELENALPWVEADRSQIDQILMNLGINACEAMDRGAGRLGLRTRRFAVEEGAREFDAPPGEYCMLQVSDTGCGMSENVRRRIFDPFYTTKKTGNGLGLSAVYGIVRNHGGVVRVESEPGAGTCFTILLPACAGREAILGVTASGGRLVGGTETVLIADDEEAVRQVAADMLGSLGYRVVLAADGEEAVRVFQERPQAIDLAVMDLAMPNLNGRAAVKAMRMLRPDLKALFSSGFSDKPQIEALRSDGFPHFLAKPYSMFDLQAAVRRALDEPGPDGA